jgi:hypothetical protein
MNGWPDDFYDFTFFPEPDDRLKELADEAECEDWAYHHTEAAHPYPVLFNYVRYTYKRVAEEGKIELSDDGQYACWNTGLVTEAQEPLFASFEVNRKEDAQPWYFKGWYRKGRRELSKFSTLPELAHYFDDPTCLVMDTRKEFRINVEHIIADNKNRFSAPYAEMQEYQLQTFLKGAVDNALERVRRNYKAAIPQYYRGQVQLLLPLCMANPHRADLALVVERHANFYRASTCLTLDMAYNNARQLARPDRDWLQP